MAAWKNVFTNIRRRFEESTVENIIWWINLAPGCLGFSIITPKNSVSFWITHFALLLYINFLSSFVYRIQLADDVDGIVQANTNLAVVIFTINISFWFLMKRSLLISTIDKVKEIDKLLSTSKFLTVKHEKLLKKLKIFVLLYYIINLSNTYLIWMPQRMNLSSAFYTPYPCPGINVTTDINKYLCRAIIFTQDLTISTVVINFQSLLLFLIAHTAGMYHLMAEEMLALTRFQCDSISYTQIQERLSILIKKHVLLLNIVQRLRSLYNMPIGVNFGTNAYCICLFFLLNLDEWISFAPLIMYCFLVFFMYCYLCQKLIDSSIVFEHSVYACGWENYLISDKKAIYIVLKQAQQPVLLLAGYMIPVNIYTFASGMQFIYKFVTALKF